MYLGGGEFHLFLHCHLRPFSIRIHFVIIQKQVKLRYIFKITCMVVKLKKENKEESFIEVKIIVTFLRNGGDSQQVLGVVIFP